MPKNKVKGERRVYQQLDRLARAFPNATTAAMYQEAGIIFNMSQEQVPVDTGNLRQSGGLFVVRRGDGHAVIISYASRYALRIHEATELDANRAVPGSADAESGKTNKTTGKSKYLEHPFNEQMTGLESRLARRVKMLLRSAGSVPDPDSLPTVRGSKKGGGTE